MSELEIIPFTNCVELLIKWDMSEEVELNFLNEGIELDEFLDMGLTRLQDFVPDNSERLRLIQNIFKYKVKHKVPSKKNVQNESSDEENPDHSGSADPDFTPNKSDSSGSESDQETTPSPAKKFCKRQVSGDSSNLSSTSKSSEKQNNSTEESEIVATTPASPASTSASLPSIPARLHSILAKNKFINLDLKQHLQSSVTTTSVFIGNSNGVLSKKNRKTLVHALAEYMLSNTERPSVADFSIIREKIYDLFPGEPEGLYYQSPTESGPHQTLARGILFNAVRNKIGKLIRANVLTSQRKASQKSGLDKSSTPDQGLPALSADVQAAVLVLKRSRAVTPDVLAKWKLAAEFRLKTLYGDIKKSRAVKSSKKEPTEAAKSSKEEPTETQDSIAKYLDEYKILKSPQGYELLVIDFQHLYPSEAQNLFSTWPGLCKKIENLALNSPIKDPVGTELVNLLKTAELDENNRDALFMQLLPSLCTPSARVTVGTKTFKPSVTESRDAFICYTKIGADVEPLIQRRRVLMAELKAPLQPYIIFQGSTRADIIAAYVVIDRILFKLNSVLESVDVCFKLFHSLCVGYPKQANHLWHFFHLGVYNIKHNPALDGQVPLSSQTFMASLKYAEGDAAAA